MIRRDDGDHWLLISQVDHAHLAVEIARVWGNASTPGLPLPDLLVPAIRDHDAGWAKWEESPQIDPKTGKPRDFTEMPMRDSTAIWTRSIDVCASGFPSQAEAMRRYRTWLDVEGREATHQDVLVLDAALQYRDVFNLREIVAEILEREPHSVSEPAVETTLHQFERAGILAAEESPLAGRRYRTTLPLVGRSPLGGIWVSRQFCWLAEKARENRTDPEDIAAAEHFLAQQAKRQADWSDDALSEFAGEDLPRLLETGYRYVQFFDRISLWLCCARRAEPETLTLPGGGTYRFVPRAGGRFEVEPWPLRVDELDLCVYALPARQASQSGDSVTRPRMPLESVRCKIVRD